MDSKPRAVADVAAGVILATVEIAAARERVFKALTDPRELIEWWGAPDAYRAHTWEADFRVGGLWRVAGKGVEGNDYSVSGRFIEIDPPRKVVQTWLHDWDEGHPETKITYLLEEIAEGTRLTVRHEGFVGRAESCNRHANGWNRVLGWLERHATVTDDAHRRG